MRVACNQAGHESSGYGRMVRAMSISVLVHLRAPCLVISRAGHELALHNLDEVRELTQRLSNAYAELDRRSRGHRSEQEADIEDVAGPKILEPITAQGWNERFPKEGKA